MPTYSYFCKACEEAYSFRISTEEQEARINRCPNCGEEEKQELYAVGPDGDENAQGGCCGGGGRGCHGCH